MPSKVNSKMEKSIKPNQQILSFWGKECWRTRGGREIPVPTTKNRQRGGECMCVQWCAQGLSWLSSSPPRVPPSAPPEVCTRLSSHSQLWAGQREGARSHRSLVRTEWNSRLVLDLAVSCYIPALEPRTGSAGVLSLASAVSIPFWQLSPGFSESLPSVESWKGSLQYFVLFSFHCGQQRLGVTEGIKNSDQASPVLGAWSWINGNWAEVPLT